MRRLISDALRYLPSQLVPALAALVALPLITRGSSPDAFGEYAIALATLNLLLVCSLWAGHAVVRLVPAARAEGGDAVFGWATVTATAVTVVVLGGAALATLVAAGPMLSESLTRTLQAALVAFALKSFSDNLTQLLRARGQAASYSTLRSIEALVAASVGVVLLYATGSVSGLFWGAAGAAGLVLVPAWVLALRSAHTLPALSAVTDALKAMARFGLPLTVAGLATWVLALSDRYFVAALQSAEAAGLYAAGYSFAQKPMLLLITVLVLAYRPIGAELYDSQGERAAASFLNGTARLVVLSIVPVGVWLAVGAEPIVLTLSGEAYREAAVVMPVIALGMLLFGLANLYQEGLGFVHRTGRVLVATAAAAGVNVAANVALVPRFGMMAAAWNTCAAFTVLLTLTALWSRREFAWTFPWRSAGVAVVGGSVAAVTGALVVRTIDAPLVASTASLTAVAVAYGLVLVALNEVSPTRMLRSALAASSRPGEAL